MTTASLENNQLSNIILPIFKSELTNGIELRILGTSDEPWFIAKDIALMLEYKNTNKAIIDHIDKEDILTYNQLIENGGNDSLSQIIQSQTKLINESGLYSLILRSKNEKAKLFKKWVTSEVLPSLRKTGEYKFQEQIKLLTQEKDLVSQQLLTVTRNHQNILKRRKRDLYEIGNVVYIVSHDAFTHFYQDNYHKIGIATQTKAESIPSFTGRFSTYNTSAPTNYKVHFLMYIEDNKLVEDILKLKFKDHIEPGNKEWIKSIKLEDIIDFLRKLCHFIGLPYNSSFKDFVITINNKT